MAMDDARLVKLSKFLGNHLRHQPERLGLRLDPGGWVEVDEILDACARHRVPMTRALIDEVVSRNSKRRFAFDESGSRLWAQQGHGVAIDLQLEPAVPPPVLDHGTPLGNVEPILRDGLLKMSRHHVHLSPDVPTPRAVGARRGRPEVHSFDPVPTRRNAFVFFRSGNGVWIVDHIPCHCLAPFDDDRHPDWPREMALRRKRKTSQLDAPYADARISGSARFSKVCRIGCPFGSVRT